MIDATHCTGCGADWIPPARRCERCGSSAVEGVQLTGDGVVRSFTWVHSDARSPRPWGLTHVETAEGVLLVGLCDHHLQVGEAAVVTDTVDGLPVYARRNDR